MRELFIEEIPEMDSRINKLPNITGNGPQRPSETTWSLPIMMFRNWKSVCFFSFSESNKKSNVGLLKQMWRCPRNNPLFLFSLSHIIPEDGIHLFVYITLDKGQCRLKHCVNK